MLDTHQMSQEKAADYLIVIPCDPFMVFTTGSEHSAGLLQPIGELYPQRGCTCRILPRYV